MGPRLGGAPQRSCIACRREGDKAGFIRFVVSPDGELTPDLDEKLPGRGAYVCVSRRCLVDAVKRRMFSRSFKSGLSLPSPDELDILLQSLMEKRVAGYISLANKAGAVISGGEAIERVLKGAQRPSLLLLAKDISDSIAVKLDGIACRAGLQVERVLTKEALGYLLGKESDRSAVAIMSPGFGQSLIREIVRYRNYLEEESGR